LEFTKDWLMGSRKLRLVKPTLTFSAVRARQSPAHTVLSFAAKASDLSRIATISRIGRDERGVLSGFQRPQIASHISEIRDYLAKETAVLPNPIVVAFTESVTVTEKSGGIWKVIVDVSNGPPGLVVDGQQRFAALSQIEGRDFELFVSALICEDQAELRRQFVLINNTRPLSKSLIYELLPSVDGLPRRLSGRALAAELTARLNYDERSSLRGLIHQHTNPGGLISDTAIQRVLMHSLGDGIMREYMRKPGGRDRCFELVSEFYRAVATVFPEAWKDQTPKTSRLVHGAGIVALGEVMETLALLEGAQGWEEFARGMGSLVGRTAWTSGEWDFGNGDRRHWKAVQNVTRDIEKLRDYLNRIVRADIRRRRSESASNVSNATG
jgi:DGQHR domain-containing protein